VLFSGFPCFHICGFQRSNVVQRFLMQHIYALYKGFFRVVVLNGNFFLCFIFFSFHSTEQTFGNECLELFGHPDLGGKPSGLP
jgi:hypothetical protein